MFPAAVAVGGLWLALALSSVFAPDLIGGVQDHVPIVAITIWIWGAVATGFVLFGAAFPARDRMARWALPAAVLGIWGAVALVSIYAPTIVTGSDGTIVPVAGLFAPVAGTVATGYACWPPPGRPCRSGAFEGPTSLRCACRAICCRARRFGEATALEVVAMDMEGFRDRADEALTQGEDEVDERTGGRFDEQTDRAADEVRERADGVLGDQQADEPQQ